MITWDNNITIKAVNTKPVQPVETVEIVTRVVLQMDRQRRLAGPVDLFEYETTRG